MSVMDLSSEDDHENSDNERENGRNNGMLTVEVSFGYFKQGDDFGHCDGDLNSFIRLHQGVIDHARAILDLIPDDQKHLVKGDGDTHFCTLTGPKEIMDNLVKNDLAYYIDYE